MTNLDNLIDLLTEEKELTNLLAEEKHHYNIKLNYDGCSAFTSFETEPTVVDKLKRLSEVRCDLAKYFCEMEDLKKKYREEQERFNL